MTRFAVLASLATAVLVGHPNAAHAHQNPEDFAARCVAKAEQSLARVRNAIADDLHRCLPAIRRAKAAGNRPLAIRLARECVDSINGTTRAGHNFVRGLCTRCVDHLLSIGEFRLAARVRAACGDILDAIEAAGERGRNAVREALYS